MTNTHLAYGRFLRATAIVDPSAVGELTITLSKVTFYEKSTVVEGAVFAESLETGESTMIPDASVTLGSAAPVSARTVVVGALGRIRQFTVTVPPADTAAESVQVKIGDSSVRAGLA